MNKEILNTFIQSAGILKPEPIFGRDSRYYVITPVQLEAFARLLIGHCGYLADVFGSLESPINEFCETPSEYIKMNFGIKQSQDQMADDYLRLTKDVP